MLKISDKQFARIMGIPKSYTVHRLMNEILLLKFKLDNIDDQSWYFRMAEKSHRKKLQELKNNYNNIRDKVNNLSFEQIDCKIGDMEKKLDRKIDSFVASIFYNIDLARYRYWKEIRELKEEYKELPELNTKLNKKEI